MYWSKCHGRPSIVKVRTPSRSDIRLLTALLATKAAKSLLALPQYQNAQRLSVYLSMPSGEISTAMIVDNALESGKEVFVPYYYKRKSPPEDEPVSIMDMVQLHSLQDYQRCRPDKWGIPTPSGDSIAQRRNTFGSFGRSEVSPSSGSEWGLDLVVLPGMAFDRQLGRLGHGKGFYDYFLERTAKESSRDQIKMPFLGEYS